MAEIRLQMGIRIPQKTLYDALTTPEGLAGWLTREVRAERRLGANCAFVFEERNGEGAFVANMLVRELRPGSGLVWECVGGPSEWLGTTISFSWMPEGEKTMLCFEHAGWKGPTEFFARSSSRWEHLLGRLKSHLEAGQETP